VRAGLLRHMWDANLGRFLRGYVVRVGGERERDPTLESSVAGLYLFGVLPPADPRVAATMRAVREGLWVKTRVGGLARYARDHYFRRTGDFERVPGNPWIVCTLWLALWHVATARSPEELRPARELLEWAAQHALPGGILPEQLHPETGEPLSVAPLTWSHATYVFAVLQYLERARQMEERQLVAQAWHAAP